MRNKSVLKKIFGETMFADPDLFGQSREEPTGAPGLVTKYKGVRIYREPSGAYYTSLDRDSEFESIRDAKKVIDHFRRNPSMTAYIVIPVEFDGERILASDDDAAFVDEERNTRPVRNIAAGFVDEDGQFHPIRASWDYSASRAGEKHSGRPKSGFKFRNNIAAGFVDEEGIFHPIRASYDYSHARAGERRRRVRP